ncbi:MAG TPA: hypothetical protein VFC07_12390, partial [Verrucomicrobiae bacterium]|nr:hypothetical protein [Verrucomicrobiae bacterium]
LKIFVVVALVAMLGAHWMLLQTVAWTTMLADNLHSSSFHDAVAKTFDGKHPCRLCKAVAAGKKSEQKSEFTPQVQKLEFPPAKENPILIAPPSFQLLPESDSFAESSPPQPPTPPPRQAFL